MKKRRRTQMRIKRAFFIFCILCIFLSISAAVPRYCISIGSEKKTVKIPEQGIEHPFDITQAVIEAVADNSLTPYLRDSDAQILAKIAMAEAEGETVEGKALVICVVINRVKSDDFPDSISEVVFQDGQFSSVCEGGRYYSTEPNDECYEALDLVMSGWDKSEGALYFESVSNTDPWHKTCLTYLFQYGGHLFYKA